MRKPAPTKQRTLETHLETRHASAVEHRKTRTRHNDEVDSVEAGADRKEPNMLFGSLENYLQAILTSRFLVFLLQGTPARNRAKSFNNKKFGRGARIRTADLLRPRQARYQAAPRPEGEDASILPSFPPRVQSESGSLTRPPDSTGAFRPLALHYGG